jgi:signal transduction histidine kinase/CheY-like chemotaxis protein/HPt (histidine-containing phosphotransfer) domain-containing protein
VGPSSTRNHPSARARAAVALVLALLAPPAVAAPPDDFPLNRQFEVLADPAGRFTLDDVLQPPLSERFERHAEEAFGESYTDVVYWFRVGLPAEAAPGDWLLQFGYPLLDFVDVWLPAPGGGFTHVELGDQRPFAERVIQNRNLVVPLALAPDSGRTLYVRVQTQSSMQVSLHLWSHHAFINRTQPEQYVLGMFYGTMLVMLVYNLFAFLLVRDTSYVYYIAYIAVITLLQASLNGLTTQYLFGDSPFWANQIVPFSLALTILFASLFTHAFLDTPRNLPVLNRLLVGLFGFSVLCTIGIFFVPYGTSIRATSVLAACMTFVFFAIGLRALMVGVRAARFFMLAWAVYLLSIQLRILLGFGWVPSNLFTLYSPQIGGALEVTLLALALADRITLERQEKERLGRERAVAQAATAAKSEFLARMSHEIRTPINAVTGFTDLALRTPDEAQRVDYLRQIRSASRALLTIINDILDMSRVEAGKLALAPQDFKLLPLLDSVREMFALQAADKQVELAVSASPEVPPALRGDPVRLEQVLINLLANALKFTERGRVALGVTLDSATPGEAVLRFEVTDTGIGIGPEERARLFEPFSQADESITRRYGGTGLGLAICKQLVELMGGTIGVDSERGRGSTFHFTVRLGRVAAPTPDTQPESAALPHFAGARVLVVEDNALNQRLAKELLAALGAHVTVAANGLEAVAAVEGGAFDAVLMDVEMPQLDGLEATRRIRALPSGGGVPVIAMTAHAQAGSREQCLAAGMTDFISKPVTAHGLASTLARHLAASVPPAAGAAARPAAAALPDALPGIAVGKAVRRLGGNAGLMRTSLLEFGRDYAGTAAELDRAVAAGDLKQAARLAHTLKGVAANLAMPDLEQAAALAEKELVERGQLPRPRLERVAAALAVAVASTATLQPEAASPPAPRLSRDELGAALEELRGLAERNDFRAQALLQRCEPSLREQLGSDATRPLADALAGFNFAQARASLAELLRQLAQAGVAR